MAWIRDWIFAVISPFLIQLKNRLGNIKILTNGRGDITFTNAENVATTVRVGSSSKLIPMTKGAWTNVVKFTAGSKFGCSFDLSFRGVYGSYVVSQQFKVAIQHHRKISVIAIHDEMYGRYIVEIFTDAYGNGALSIIPTSGSTESKDFEFTIDNFNGDSFELGYSGSRTAGYSSASKRLLSKDIGIKKEREAFATKLVTSQPFGTVNVNPMMANEDEDYKNLTASLSNRFSFDPTVVEEGGGGSIKLDGTRGTYFSDNYYPIDIHEKEYRASVSVKGLFNGVSSPDDEVMIYIGAAYYDSDYNIIYPQHLAERSGTEGFLTVPLNVGDTTITFTGDLSKWYKASTSHKRSVRMHHKQSDGSYRYIGANGRLYTNKGYTRYTAYQGYAQNGIVDNDDGTLTITLNSPWNGEPMLVDDRICNTLSGGNYNYWLSSWRFPLDGEWHRKSSPWKSQPHDQNPKLYTKVLRDGAAYMKVLGLLNYRYYNADGAGSYNLEDVTAWYGKISLDVRHKR